MKPNPSGLDENSTVRQAALNPRGGARHPHVNWASTTLTLALLLSGCASPNPRPAWIGSGPDSCASRQSSGHGASEPWDRPRPAAGPTVGLGDPELRLEVLTFNIHGLPRWLGGPPHRRFHQIARAIETQAPDIVLLQEAWTRPSHRAAPAGADWHYAWSTRSRSLFAQSGLVTVSRHRMVGGEFRPFRRAALLDSLVTKGALKVTLELSGGARVNVWNVHLQAGAAGQIRVHQVAELIKWIHHAEDGQMLDVVGGDFNCTPTSAEYAALAAGLGTDVHRSADRPHRPTYPAADGDSLTGRTLDYVFWRARSRMGAARARADVVFAADRREDRLSDHFGVRASLVVAPDPIVVATAAPFSLAGWPQAASLRRQLAPLDD